MSEAIAWLFPVVLGELAILFFLLFRLVYRSRPLQALLALFAAVSLVFCVLAVAVYLTAGPLVFAAQGQLMLVAAAAVLLILVVVFARTRELPETTHPHWARRWEEKVAERRARGEAERQKPSIARALFSCLFIGIVLFVGTILLVGAMTILAP